MVTSPLDVGRLAATRRPSAARERLEAVYDSAARLIDCDRGEIALLENATRAFNAALYGSRSSAAT